MTFRPCAPDITEETRGIVHKIQTSPEGDNTLLPFCTFLSFFIITRRLRNATARINTAFFVTKLK